MPERGGEVSLAGLASLPGLNVSRGLPAVRGKTASYLELLHLFVETHADDMARLEERLAVADHAAAQRLAHSIKGAAGTLGMEHMANIALRLEEALRIAADSAMRGHAIDSNMEAIRLEFTRLAAALPALPVLAATATLAGATSVSQVIDELSALLAQGDFSALAQLPCYASQLRATLGPRCDELAQHIRQFEFKAAEATLRSLRETPGLR